MQNNTHPTNRLFALEQELQTERQPNSKHLSHGSLFELEQMIQADKQKQTQHPAQPIQPVAPQRNVEEIDTPCPNNQLAEARTFDWDEAIQLQCTQEEAQAFDWDEAIQLQYAQETLPTHVSELAAVPPSIALEDPALPFTVEPFEADTVAVDTEDEDEATPEISPWWDPEPEPELVEQPQAIVNPDTQQQPEAAVQDHAKAVAAEVVNLLKPQIDAAPSQPDQAAAFTTPVVESTPSKSVLSSPPATAEPEASSSEAVSEHKKTEDAKALVSELMDLIKTHVKAETPPTNTTHPLNEHAHSKDNPLAQATQYDQSAVPPAMPAPQANALTESSATVPSQVFDVLDRRLEAENQATQPQKQVTPIADPLAKPVTTTVLPAELPQRQISDIKKTSPEPKTVEVESAEIPVQTTTPVVTEAELTEASPTLIQTHNAALMSQFDEFDQTLDQQQEVQRIETDEKGGSSENKLNNTINELHSDKLHSNVSIQMDLDYKKPPKKWTNIVELSTKAGAMGVIKVKDNSGKIIYVKGLEEATCQQEFGDYIFERFGIPLAEQRIISHKKEEFTAILSKLQEVSQRIKQELLQQINSSSTQEQERIKKLRERMQEQEQVIRKIDKWRKLPGTLLVMKKADIVAFNELDTHNIKLKKSNRGKASSVDFKRLFLATSADKVRVWDRLGLLYALDAFLGNEDRIEGNKYQNVFIDLNSNSDKNYDYSAMAMDNDIMFPAFISQLTIEDSSKPRIIQYTKKQWLETLTGGGNLYPQPIQENKLANLELISGDDESFKVKTIKVFEYFIKNLLDDYNSLLSKSKLDTDLNELKLIVDSLKSISSENKEDFLHGADYARKNLISEAEKIKSAFKKIETNFKSKKNFKKPKLISDRLLMFSSEVCSIKLGYLSLRQKFDRETAISRLENHSLIKDMIGLKLKIIVNRGEDTRIMSYTVKEIS